MLPRPLALSPSACSQRPAPWDVESAPVICTRRDGGPPQLHRLDPTTGANPPVVPDSGSRWGTSLSPDGARLACISRQDGNENTYVRGYDLRAVRAADGGDILVLATDADETEGVWAPAAERR